MIDLDGIFGALVEQWDTTPSATRSQFTGAVESRGIATQVEAELYVSHFLARAVELALLDTGDWINLQGRVQAVGLERATEAGRKIHNDLRERAPFRIDRLTVLVAAHDTAILELDRLKANAEIGRTEIESRFPPNGLRDDTLAVLGRGINQIDGSRPVLVRRRAKFADELATLEG